MSPEERARIAHCLITSLDNPEESSVDEAWIKLAEKRLSEIESGKIEAVSWDEIKQKVKNI